MINELASAEIIQKKVENSALPSAHLINFDNFKISSYQRFQHILYTISTHFLQKLSKLKT